MDRRDPLELIAEGREKLAGEDRSGWADVALSDRMSAVTVEFERLGAEVVRLAAEWNARGAWGADGFVSPAAWLAAHGRMTRAGAGRVVRSARHIAKFSLTGAALADGRVTAAKVELLAEVARHREKLGVATILWTRGYDGSGCSVGSVGLGGSAVIEVDLVA